MSHNGMCVRIRLAVVGALLCLAMVCAATVIVLMERARIWPGDAARIYAWLAVTLAGVLPYLAAAALGWRVSCAVARDKTFSRETAKLLSGISTCAYADGCYGLAANVVMGILRNQHPGIMIILCALILLALAAGMGFAALARFVQKAAELQEESDLTV